MVHNFDRLSLSVALDHTWFPYDERYLWGPSAFGLPILRVFAHEMLHFWQLLGSGYIANLALEDWRSRNAGGDAGTAGAQLSRSFHVADPATKFSPYQLHEALCRYWDIHIVGPGGLLGEPDAGESVDSGHGPPDVPEWNTRGLPSEVVKRIHSTRAYSGDQFDRWMLSEDDYAEPYRIVLERFGSRRSAVLFPLVAYFAMQTPKPCRVFSDVLLNRLAGPGDFPPGEDIHSMWRSVFKSTADACAASSFTQTGRLLTSGLPVIRQLAKEGNRVYSHYFSALSAVGMKGNVWDVVLALPGDPEMRPKLAGLFPPTVTLFANGRWAVEGEAARLARADGKPDILTAEQVADEAEAIRARGKAADLARLTAGFHAD